MRRFVLQSSAVFFFLLFAFACQKEIPVTQIKRPDSNQYLIEALELYKKGNLTKAKVYFSTFLRQHEFNDEEIYSPDALDDQRYATLLSQLPQETVEKYSLTPAFLRSIHAGELMKESQTQVAQKSTPDSQTTQEEVKVLGEEVPKNEKTKSQELPSSRIIPEPKSEGKKEVSREHIPPDRTKKRFNRLAIKHTNEKEILFKTNTLLTTDEVIEIFNLSDKPDNVSQVSGGFKIKLPYTTQHLGGRVGKKRHEGYIVSRRGETLHQIVENVGEIVPALCKKRIYRCSIFEKKAVTGKIANAPLEAAKKIYLWNKGVLGDYLYEELIEGKTKITGGTTLQIYTDFY